MLVGYHYLLTIYGVWPVLLTAPLCGNHNQFTLLYFALSCLYFHPTFDFCCSSWTTTTKTRNMIHLLLVTLKFDINIHQEIGVAQARDIQIMSHHQELYLVL